MDVNYDAIREDLRFPAFKLAHRAEYERECAYGRTCSTSTPTGDVVDPAALKRAEACEAAIAILAAAS